MSILNVSTRSKFKEQDYLRGSCTTMSRITAFAKLFGRILAEKIHSCLTKKQQNQVVLNTNLQLSIQKGRRGFPFAITSQGNLLSFLIPTEAVWTERAEALFSVRQIAEIGTEFFRWVDEQNCDKCLVCVAPLRKTWAITHSFSRLGFQYLICWPF